MTKTKKIQMLLLAIALFVSCFFTCFVSTTNVAYASSIGVVGGYTDVMEDLQKDDTFNPDDYPVKENDYSLSVIQIAESSDKELFVYVYQPNENYGSIKATTINISCALHKKESIKNYSLTMLNYNGVFQKYVVNGLTMSNDTTRYYEIVSIFRAWNEQYDEQASGGNTISEISFPVAKQYTIIDKDGETYINVANEDVVTIVNKYVGFLRYLTSDAPSWLQDGRGDYFDSHFVAFSTDKEIDRLFEADVYFTTQSVHRYNWNITDFRNTDFGVKQENYAFLDYTQNTSLKQDEYDNGIWHSVEYSFERIQSVDNFIDNENREQMYSHGIFDSTVHSKITDSGLNDLKDMQWVLRFYESDYSLETKGDPYGAVQNHEDYTIVGDVSILRLKFETDGVVYNLGVIDNKQTGDGIADNETWVEYSLNDTFKIILIILLLIVLLIVLNSILPYVFKFIGFIFKAIWWVISAPFKLIKAIFKKRE